MNNYYYWFKPLLCTGFLLFLTISTTFAEDTKLTPLEGADFVLDYYFSGEYDGIRYYTVEVDAPPMAQPCKLVSLKKYSTSAVNENCQGVVLAEEGSRLIFWFNDLVTGKMVFAEFLVDVKE